MKKEPHLESILNILKETYPDAHCALDHKNPLQLLVATILSAQCTDKRVNVVTKTLFIKYKNAKDFASANPLQLEYDIHSTGFYRQKTKSIIGSCKMISETHSGDVPKTMEELTQLPGVARKTANVVLGTAFKIADGIVVDTHVKRLAQRLHLTKNSDPNKIESDLMEIIPKKDWIWFSHALITHGRVLCKAITPLCVQCPLKEICPSAEI